MKTSFHILLTIFVLFSANTFAADKVGSKDHPLLKRYEGSSILDYSQLGYAEYSLALGKALNRVAPASQGRSIEKEAMLEGKVTRITYLAPTERSALEVFRNYEQELAEKGFEILFKGEKEQLGYRFAARYDRILSRFAQNNSDNRFVAARLNRPEGNVTVALFVLKPMKGETVIQLDVVEEKALEQKMITVPAEEMENQIATNGRIALYGIQFDTNEATIRTESSATITEMAKLLKNSPNLRVLVVGHTDTDGSFEYNRSLSQRRAESVVADLVNRGIAKERLFPVGMSFASPVATNASPEGKAKNRRVELVDMRDAKRD